MMIILSPVTDRGQGYVELMEMKAVTEVSHTCVLNKCIRVRFKSHTCGFGSYGTV